MYCMSLKDPTHTLSIICRVLAWSGRFRPQFDAWTAGNGNGYCTVTAHWIEETALTSFELKNAVISFVSVPHSHTGKRLGQVVYKVWLASVLNTRYVPSFLPSSQTDRLC